MTSPTPPDDRPGPPPSSGGPGGPQPDAGRQAPPPDPEQPTAPTQPLAGAAPAPPPPPPPRRLTRSRADRFIAGVSGGLGRFFGIDPVVFRIGFVILTLFGGSGILIYLLLALLVPGDGEAPDPDRSRGLVKGLLIAAAVLGALTLGWGGAVAVAFGGGAFVAGAVIVAGLALVVGGFLGGARWLILPAFLVALPLAFVAAADIELDGGVGEREYRPQTVADLRTDYDLGVGELRLDLRHVDLPAGVTELDAHVGIGSLKILVPETACVQTAAHAGIGAVEVLDRDSGGIDVGVQHRPAPRSGVPVLAIDAETGIGEIRIQRDGAAFDQDFGDGGPFRFDDGFDDPIVQPACAGRA